MNDPGGGPPGGGGNPGGFGNPPGGGNPGGGFGNPPGGGNPGGGFGNPPGGGNPGGGFGNPPGGGYGNPPGGGNPGGGFGNPPGGGFGNPPGGGNPGGGGFGAPPGAPGGGGFGNPPSGVGFQSSFGGGGAPAPAPAPKKKRSPIVYLLVLAPIALCCFGGMGLLVYGGVESSKYDELKPACDGVAVASAPAYQPGGTAHAVGFDRGSSGNWILHYAFTPRARRGDEVGDTAVVVCVEPESEERLERCAYTVGSAANAIDRYRYQRTVRMVAASTGQVIASTVIYGTEPTACEDWETFAGGGTTVERRGGTVTDDAISSWVAGAL